MKFLCPRVFIIFFGSMIIAALLWFYSINQIIVEMAIEKQASPCGADVVIQNMKLHIDNIIVTADKVMADKASKNLTLLGNAKLNWNEYELWGTDFRYSKNEHLIKTVEPVTIIMPHVRTIAGAMELDIQNKFILLSGNVTTVFDKK